MRSVFPVPERGSSSHSQAGSLDTGESDDYVANVPPNGTLFRKWFLVGAAEGASRRRREDPFVEELGRTGE